MVATTAMWHATSACRPRVSLRGSGTSADRVPLAYVAATSTANVAEDVVESEQDHMLKLNKLAGKKRINLDEAQDYFRSMKRSQDFISIKDFDELNDEMVYLVQKIFLGFHHGLGIDDLARTFSSFLLVKVDKRNMNLNK
ncbi:hypothetical protein Tco_1325184 [Tanacetum coccineum]